MMTINHSKGKKNKLVGDTIQVPATEGKMFESNVIGSVFR
jgi:hypothetical protein